MQKDEGNEDDDKCRLILETELQQIVIDEILHLQPDRHDLEHEIEVHLVCIDDELFHDFDEVLH